MNRLRIVRGGGKTAVIAGLKTFDFEALLLGRAMGKEGMGDKYWRIRLSG
jgi:hypothetical protein